MPDRNASFLPTRSLARLSALALALAAVTAIVASCATPPPAPAVPGVGTSGAQDGLPFEVPEGALFVARTSSAKTVFRLSAACKSVRSMKPGRVKFFWTLEAARRAGYHLARDPACR